MKNNNILKIQCNFSMKKLAIIVLVWHATLLFLGQIVECLTFGKNLFIEHGYNDTVFFLSHTIRWDSGWLLNVANNFYKDSEPSAAFYPLFPLASFLVSKLSFNFLSIIEAGFLINIVSTIIATVFLSKISLFIFENEKLAWVCTLLFLLLPSAFFLHVFYTEALFCAIAFVSYYLSLKRRWLASCIFLSLLTSTRLPSILFVGLIGLEYFRAKEWSFRNLDYKALFFLLSPIGFIFYGFFLEYRTGNFFGMFSAYKATTDWAYHVFNINFIETVYKTSLLSLEYIFGIKEIHKYILLSNYIFPLFGYFLLVITSIYSIFKIKGPGIPLGIFGLLSSIMFTLNSNMVSVHRYILPCLVIYLSISHFLKEYYSISDNIIYTALALSFLLQVWIFSLFVGGYFMG